MTGKRKSGGGGGKAKALKPEPPTPQYEHIARVTTWSFS